MSRFVFAGNEIIPGTITITADGSHITPKDDLRVVTNISGSSTVILDNGTDTTQRVEIFNVSASDCAVSYLGADGSQVATLSSKSGARMLWVGSYWDCSVSTPVTGIDDDNQPFAYNIESLVSPKGIVNFTGKDSNGLPFDFGINRVVTAAEADAVSLINLVYPVGSIYMSVNNISPANFIGGSWEQIQDTFLLSAGSTYTAGDTGGSATVTLTTNQIPSHRHTFNNGGSNVVVTDSTQTGNFTPQATSLGATNSNMRHINTTDYAGNGQAHNNMPPYLVVYMWKRIA